MERRIETHEPIELGTVSEQTLGAKGIPTDFVRDLPGASGISDD